MYVMKPCRISRWFVNEMESYGEVPTEKECSIMVTIASLLLIVVMLRKVKAYLNTQ